MMLTGTIQSTAYGFPEMVDGAEAAADAANASGGVGGHQIHVVSCNDQNDPNVAAGCARTAVADHAAGVIEVLTNFVPQMLPILQPAGIPVLGDIPDTPQERTNPDVYPIGGGTYVVASAAGTALVERDQCMKVAVVTLNFAAEVVSGKNITDAVELAGGQVTSNQAVSPTLPGYSAVVAKALSSGAQCFAPILAAPQVQELLTAIQQSSDPTMSVATGLLVYTPQLLSEIKGYSAKSTLTSWSYPANAPQVAPFTNDMKMYRPSATVDGYALQSWMGMMSFIDAAKSLQTITGDTVRSALNSATSMNIPGVANPVSYATPNPDSNMSRITDTNALVFGVNGTSFVDKPPTINAQAALTKFFSGNPNA
jgi:branched-chain amino acid transport system substrate-binding protein